MICLLAAALIEAHIYCQMGNQMFQIAAATALALDHGTEASFPDLITSKEDGIPENYELLFHDLNTEPVKVTYEYREPLSLAYQEIPYVPNMRIWGYFQSEKFFKHHKEKILEVFAMPEEIRIDLERRYGNLLAHPRTVAVHLRSYHADDPFQKWYFQAGKRYIEKAMNYFPEDTLFLIFSNNMRWCKRELRFVNKDMIFIEGESRFHDFYLMSLCKHNIISNSSYSWWSAYLNPNPDKIVIAPKNWFSEGSELIDKDIVPEDWIQL